MELEAGSIEGEPSAELRALEQRVAHDLSLISHPRMQWLEPRKDPHGRDALDVLIVGAGQSGMAIAFGLMRSEVRNVLVVDRAAYGREGPWLTYARMDTLRSPKDYTGPDLDIPSLTYPVWHSAKFGAQDWKELGLIPRELWAEYLLWVRRMTKVPVRNELSVVDIRPEGEILAVQIENDDGQRQQFFARKVVLATGQEGTGHWWMPDDVAALPERFRAHAADDIDFESLRCKTVAVLGAGASAFDNAAVALEKGAAAVNLFCRRDTPQVIQPYRWLTFRGFLRHLGDLDDAWRWRFMRHIMALREGFPQATYDRCARHDNFRLVAGAPLSGFRVVGDQVEISTPRGGYLADFIVCGTGVEMDFSRRPELVLLSHFTTPASI